MLDVEVLEQPAAAAAVLDPVRGRLLAELRTPASAATLAVKVGLPRQKVNYHLRTLERFGLVCEAEKRKWGGITERLMKATALSYVVSPAAMGPVASTPEKTRDHLSASYLVALAARAIREVGALIRRADAESKRLPSLSVDTEIRFRSPAERAAFTNDLAQAVARLAARYHDANAAGGRPHRLVVLAYPTPENTAVEAPISEGASTEPKE